MQNKTLYSLIAFAVASILVVSLVSAFGNGFGMGFGKQDLTDEERTAMQQEQEAMQTAIENGDYASWKTLMEERIEKMKAEITEENFNAIVEQNKQMTEMRTAIQEAKESGDYSKVADIVEKYGMPTMGMGHGRGFRDMASKGCVSNIE